MRKRCWVNTDCRTVLVIGSGGREHALAQKLAESPSVSRVIVSPGNGGTVKGNTSFSEKIESIKVLGKSSSNEDIVKFSEEQGIALVVIGPEQPLVDGLTDDLRKAGILCFGPSGLAARLEASKAWSKDFMKRNDIRTARFQNFTDFDTASKYIESLEYNVVIKASGLAAGKGVIIPASKKEAIEAARDILCEKAFGEAGDEIVVEEFLQGEEVSVLAFCDGFLSVCMPGAQDHKRVFDGDKGPNTGGMGAYAPAPILTPELRDKCASILQKTVTAMANEGIPYEGVLYAGFIVTKNGDTGSLEPVVLEYNCRFGDPETQVLLPLLQSDLYEVLVACAEHRLYKDDVRWKKNTVACTVVCASEGYPGPYRKGDVVSIPCNTNVSTIYHAGTTIEKGKLVTSGGRVLAVTGLGSTIVSARKAAYSALNNITWEGMQYRGDIAHRALNAPVRIGVLGSTRGSALQPIIDAIEAGELNAIISLVVSNKSDAAILERAKNHNIDAMYIPGSKNRELYDEKVTAQFEDKSVDLVLMIGYMRIVSRKFTSRWSGRCLNVHPSLLPEFAGGMDLQVHQAVLDAGKSETGCTVHFVTEEVDGGPIVVQKKCEVVEGDSAESLKTRVQALEGSAMIEAIEKFSRDEIGPAALSLTLTYRSAGVNIDAGEELVETIKPFCKRTRRPGCDASLGGFGGLFDLAAAGYPAGDTILVSGTDGVGTKLKIAQAVGKHDTIGIDLVAMSVNDILVCGAEPLYFLDYFATGRLNVPEASQVIKGIAEGCHQSGCGLIGGETAEMSGMYAPGEYDLAGFAVGAVLKTQILPSNICNGDILIGLSSSGVHSNGYSLVRKCVEKSGLAWSDPSPFAPNETLSDSLLTPTKIYVRALMSLIKNNKIKGMAHITGGGITENLPRCLPKNLKARVNIVKSGWTLPPVFKWLRQISTLPQDELLRTFNCGIGMVLIIASRDVEEVKESIKSSGELNNDPIILGEVVERENDEQDQVEVLGEIS